MPSLQSRRHKTPVPLGFDIKADEAQRNIVADRSKSGYLEWVHFSKNQLEFLVLISFAIFAIVVFLVGIILAIVHFATFQEIIKTSLEVKHDDLDGMFRTNLSIAVYAP